VKWKSPKLKPTIAEEGSRRLITWTSSQLEHKSSEEDKKSKEDQTYQVALGKLPPPDLAVSSFQSWEEVGTWYNGLQQERIKPNAEIRSKAAELTKDAADENAKLHAIYNYVSTQFRYIGVAFGIGRYQPHSAPEVLSNQYGDCKDKHTLLASLLDAAGVKAYPALINTYHDLDSDIPSPAQFDHVITVVPQGSSVVWLDSTPEVARFGYLLSVLRNKPALLITPGKPSVLVTTAVDPATKASQIFKIDAKLKEDGTLEGKVERTATGDDMEVLLRTAFRRTPQLQWKDLIQQISYASGLAGDVSEVTVSSPVETSNALKFTYTYNRKDFPQWSQRRISSPLPPILGPTPNTKPSHPVLLGAIEEYHYKSRVEIPKGYRPQLPPKVDLNEDFAEYHSAYSFKDDALQTERSLNVKLREVPLSEYDAYKKFAEAVSDDHEVYVGLTQRHVTPASYQDAIWTLPYSNNADAVRAYEEAQDQYSRGDSEAEVASLRRAVEVDPKFTRAWLWMSEIYRFQRKLDLALDALRSAVANDPQQSLSYNGLGFVLMQTSRFEDAIPVWKQLMSIAPDDSDGPVNLATSLSALKRYAEAASALESALSLSPDQAAVYVQLAANYLRAGDEDKSLSAYKKAIEIDPKPVWLNDASYELADANKQLPLALQYGQRAVHEEEEASAKIKLADLKKEDLGHPSSLAAFWDTLGWVHFRLGNYEKAEKYLNAAWELSQGPVEGDHLGQVYEQEHKKEQAIRMYRLALAASRVPERMTKTRERLDRLGGTTKAGRFGVNGVEELSQMRTFKLGRIIPDTASAEFFLLFGPGSKLEEVRFVSGPEKLKAAEKVLSSAPFEIRFPDDGPTRIVRRGVLSCSSISGCSFVLYTPDLVRSVN
jgi:tetratricopeptide (TPR) repeat protein